MVDFRKSMGIIKDLLYKYRMMDVPVPEPEMIFSNH